MAREWMERAAAPLADVIVAPSQYIVDWMKKEWGVSNQNLRIIHNVLPGKGGLVENVSHLTDIADEMDYGGGPINEIAFYGRFDPLKGIDIFLDAMDRLSDTHGSVLKMVTIIGSPRSDYSMSYVNDRASKWKMPYQILKSKTPESTMNYFK